MNETWFKPSTRRYLLVEYVSFMDELGRMIGCAPPSLRQLTLIDFAYGGVISMYGALFSYRNIGLITKYFN